ncbi:MAG TPA: FG-GAP-like repeat-containing protein [Candidatus Limnocylindrales bacterium]
MIGRSLRSRLAARWSLLAGLALVVPVLAVVPAASASPSQFGAYQVTPIGPSPADAVALGDVTGDGRTDVVLTTGYANAASDFRLLVLAGRSDGALDAPVSYATAGTYPDRPESVDVGDVNGDGRLDVVVGLSGLGVQVFPQAADGTLGAPSFVASADSHKIATGVFDKTGRAQVAGVGWGTDTVTIFADTGAGLVTARTYPAQHAGYEDLETGDVSGDGLTDIVVMSGQGLVPNVSVLAQQINGTFGAAAEYSVGAGRLTRGIGVGDVTADGRSDVVASNGGNSPDGRVSVFPQTSTGLLGAPVASTSYDIPGAVEVADVDRDGLGDVVVVHEAWLRVGVYPGLADGGLGAEQLYPVPYANDQNPQNLAVGDVTGDGWPDIVVADDLHGLLVLPNTGTVAPPPTPSPSASPSYTLPPPTPTPTPSPTPTLAPTPTPTPAPVPPSVPQSLVASPNLAAGVGLAWQAPSTSGSSQVTGYRVYRGTGTAAVTPLVTVGNVLGFTDASVSNGTTYRYAVSALSAAGEGPRTAEVTAARGTAPSAPRSLTATTTKSGIALTWVAPSSNGGSAITGYRVYRGTKAGAETLYVAYGPDAVSMTDTSVTRRTTYFYKVSAVNVLGESVASGEVSATAR